MMHVKNNVFPENHFAIKKHLRKIIRKFKGDTQRLRTKVTNELKGLSLKKLAKMLRLNISKTCEECLEQENQRLKASDCPSNCILTSVRTSQ